jgi:hypothetical protein
VLLPQLQCPSAPSYKEILLGCSSSDHQGRLCLSSTVEDIATAQKPEFSKDSWQVVKSKRSRPHTMPQAVSDARRQQKRRSLFLRKMKGLCFNCVALDNKVASCHNPTRCWRCRQCGHTSVECSSTFYHPIDHTLREASVVLSIASLPSCVAHHQIPMRE